MRNVTPPLFPVVAPRNLDGVLSTYPVTTRQINDGFRDYAETINRLAAVIYAGTGSPEGVVTANPGSLYLRSDGGTATTTLYLKVTGTGTNTGWVAK